MKVHFLITIAICFLPHQGAAQHQAKDFFKEVSQHDLSNVLLPDSISDGFQKFVHGDPIGFIGDDFQRFEIHFAMIKRSAKNHNEYYVFGKTKKNDVICDFTGTITVISATLTGTSHIIDDPRKFPAGLLQSRLQFREQQTQVAGTGVITGTMTTRFYINNKNELVYDALSPESGNNEVMATWSSNRTGRIRKCNWGNGRIPDCGDLDVGDGEFVPNDKYLDNGWRDYLEEQLMHYDSSRKKWWQL